jgi:MerR family transcriptional regulator, redox-sensitive transcriptional activator SoxR
MLEIASGGVPVTIGELSKSCGLPASTLRYWERVGVLPKASRIGGQRRYPSEVVNMVAVLKLAKACGFSLPEMHQFMVGFSPKASPSERWRTSIRKHQAVLEAQVVRLNTMRRLLLQVQQCQCADLNECGRIASSLVRAQGSVQRAKLPK